MKKKVLVDDLHALNLFYRHFHHYAELPEPEFGRSMCAVTDRKNFSGYPVSLVEDAIGKEAAEIICCPGATHISAPAAWACKYDYINRHSMSIYVTKNEVRYLPDNKLFMFLINLPDVFPASLYLNIEGNHMLYTRLIKSRYVFEIGVGPNKVLRFNSESARQLIGVFYRLTQTNPRTGLPYFELSDVIDDCANVASIADYDPALYSLDRCMLKVIEDYDLLHFCAKYYQCSRLVKGNVRQ